MVYRIKVHNNIFSLSAEEKLELISQKVNFFRSQSNKFKVAFKQNNNLLAASFSVSHCIAQHDKPLSDGEYLKEVFVKASNILFHDFTNLSRGQVLHRFVELLEEIRLFLFEKSQDYPELKDLN